MRQMTREGGALTSRRRFLVECGIGSALLAMERSAKAQSRSTETAGVQFKLVREIKDSFYRTVSPDSRRLCLCSSRKPTGKFTLWGVGKDRKVMHEAPSPFVLSVVELGSWKQIYSTPLRGDPGSFSFFPDGNRLYGETSSIALPRFSQQRMLVDLRTGKVEGREQPYDRDTAAYYEALRDAILIGETNRGELVQVGWPSLEQLVRVPVQGKLGGLVMTADRQHLIHLAGQSLVCRRVENFSVVWARQIDPDIDLKAKMPWSDAKKAPYAASAHYAISADGTGDAARVPWLARCAPETTEPDHLFTVYRCP